MSVQPDKPPAQGKSKLDSLAREDLIRLLKKQLEQGKNFKQEVADLKQAVDVEKGNASTAIAQLESLQNEKRLLARRIEKLEEKQAFLNQSAHSEEEGTTASELILKAKVAELDVERNKLLEEKKEWDVMRLRLSNDAEAAQQTCLELRSQLDDAKAETCALREKRAVADVFSLEIKDFEKKVSQLEKELKEANERANSAVQETAELNQSLTEARAAAAEASDVRGQAREEAELLRKQLYEEKVKCGSATTELARVQERLDGIIQDRGSERMGLGRELATAQQRITTLEEAVEALREENSQLRADRDNCDARAVELAKDYESFKSRARFVLEQKKAESDTVQADDSKHLEDTIAELQDKVEQTRKQLNSTHQDGVRLRERNSQLETDSRNNRRDADEAQLALASTMDDLRSCRSELEKSLLINAQLSSTIKSLEEENLNVRCQKEKLETLFSSERLRFEEESANQSKQLADERTKREEVQQQLADTRKEEKVTRLPPVAAVFPQFSERDVDRCHSVISEKLSTPVTEKDLQTQDQSLEDVLFGDTNTYAYSVSMVGEERSLEEVVEELDRLRKHADNTRELLNESEAANGRLIEQSRFLKDEIRRLERNEERKTHFENTEYLKNVIVKFLTPEQVEGEKAQLIPILNTMLRLSSEELAIVQRAASTDSTAESGGTSWGSYIRWGGLS